MHVTIKLEWQKFIEDQVKSGRFASPTEVLEAGLARLLLDPPPDELDAEDWAAIDEGLAQAERGECLDWKVVSTQLRKEYLGE